LKPLRKNPWPLAAVNVEPGISFTYDSTHKILTYGYEDLNAV
jgi:hypothetical protein